MIEEVGKIIDGEQFQNAEDTADSEPEKADEEVEPGNQQPNPGSQEGNQDVREQKVIPNPKKRMWDAAVEEKKAAEEQSRKRDEL